MNQESKANHEKVHAMDDRGILWCPVQPNRHRLHRRRIPRPRRMARPPLDPDSLGGRLEILTRERRVTLVDLARQLNVSQSSLSIYIHGRATPGGDILNKLADHFGVSVDWLLCRTDVRCPSPRAGQHVGNDHEVALALRGDAPDGTVSAFEVALDLRVVTPDELAILDLPRAARRRRHKLSQDRPTR